MAIGSSELTARVAVLRPGPPTDDGISVVPGVLAQVAVLDARRRDLSDGERVRGGIPSSRLVARFVVHAGADVRRSDVLEHQGQRFAVTGIRALDRLWVEVSAAAEVGGMA
ncbi:MAG: hypothetical protein BWX69_03051 [Planctomycetes bacterium ADurb.Bin069]|nr:MAG: hypothetical protein BWX69_03051 [Planctomycetes bacterium ADurb.Bin069]